jgi:4-amino-4-deoxy-L-arabinose transferase-like glycosyltransferase
VLALFALALIVRSVAVLADGGYEPRNDAFDYDRHAASLAAGDGYPSSIYGSGGGPTALRPPAYPLALAGVYALSGDSIIAGRLLGALLGAIAVLLVYAIAARLWGSRAGFAAGALAAVYPPLVAVSLELFSENLYLVGLLGAVLLVLIAREDPGRLRWAAAAGAVAGVALLTRNAALALLLPLVIGLWGRPPWRLGAAGPPLLALLCAVLVLAPWTIRNAIEFGRLIPIAASSGVTLAGTYNEASFDDADFPAAWRNPSFVPEFATLFATPAIDEATFDRTLREEAGDFIVDHPGYALEASARNLARMAGLDEGAVVTAQGEVTETGIGNRAGTVERLSLALAALLAGIAMFAFASAARRRRRGEQHVWPRPGPLFLWLVPLLVILTAAPLGGLPRYRLPADPFLLMAGGVGLVWAWDRVRRRRAAARAALAAGAVLGALMLAGCGGDDPDGGPTAPSATRAEEPRDAVAPGKAGYIRRADAICAEAIAETRAFRKRLGSVPPPPAPSAVAQFTEALVAPGIPILERQARRLRALPRPADDAETLEAYLGLFDVTSALLRERLRVGREGNLTVGLELEDRIFAIGDEQLELAREYGFETCSTDLGRVLLPPSQPE